MATLHGSGFSIQPKFSQSAYFRFHNQSEVLENLFFVGAGTHPGAGMPGVYHLRKYWINFLMETNLLKKHAKSFYWASFFLSREVLKKSVILYNFCRTLDDIVDEHNVLEVKKTNFQKFKKNFLNKDFNDPIIKDMWSIINSENISHKIVVDLFDGVETDLEKKVQINTKKDLLVYSYRVWNSRSNDVKNT